MSIHSEPSRETLALQKNIKKNLNWFDILPQTIIIEFLIHYSWFDILPEMIIIEFVIHYSWFDILPETIIIEFLIHHSSSIMELKHEFL